MGMTRQRELPVTDMAESVPGSWRIRRSRIFIKKESLSANIVYLSANIIHFTTARSPILSETNELMERENLLSRYGTAAERVERAAESLRQGRGILLVDDENRENEGDLIFAATNMTVEQMALMIRRCSGIVCLCLTEERVRQLDLPPMSTVNTSRYGTAFTVSIEAAEGITTGVSAADRIRTIRTAVAPDARPESPRPPRPRLPSVRPAAGGVLERGGHTEGSVDLTKLAGLATLRPSCANSPTKTAPCSAARSGSFRLRTRLSDRFDRRHPPLPDGTGSRTHRPINNTTPKISCQCRISPDRRSLWDQAPIRLHEPVRSRRNRPPPLQTDTDSPIA